MARKSTSSPVGDSSNCIFNDRVSATGINRGTSSCTTLKRRKTQFMSAKPDGTLIAPARVAQPPMLRGASPTLSASSTWYHSCGNPSESNLAILRAKYFLPTMAS